MIAIYSGTKVHLLLGIAISAMNNVEYELCAYWALSKIGVCRRHSVGRYQNMAIIYLRNPRVENTLRLGGVLWS